MGDQLSKFSYIDLFAGAGGLSEGFIDNGFTPLAHVEADAAAAFTLKTRTAYHFLTKNGQKHSYREYLNGKISRQQLYDIVPAQELQRVINDEIGRDNRDLFDRVDKLVGGNEIDLIIGGPPCQAYSVVGRAPLKHRTDDERTKLYVQYGRFLKRYQPKAFLFENVPGIISAGGGAYFRNLKKYYKRLGYEVEARLFNARSFNVVQSRVRVIIIGWKKELGWSYPSIPTSDPVHFRDDIFTDLPSISPGENRQVALYDGAPTEYLTDTGIRNGEDFVTQHIARPHNRRDLAIYKLAIEQWSKGYRLRNNEIPDEIRTQKNVSSFLDRFKVVADVPHTLIAHIAKDGHHFIHPDQTQLRSISVREAARIQSFPDSYFFEGSKETGNRSAAFRQIGNAVPPLMSRAIAATMKAMIQDADRTRV